LDFSTPSFEAVRIECLFELCNVWPYIIGVICGHSSQELGEGVQLAIVHATLPCAALNPVLFLPGEVLFQIVDD